MSNSVLYYFSASGNSLQVAKILAQSLNAQLINIASLADETSVQCEAETVGIVCPVFYFGLPKIVVEFVQKLKITNENAYVFAVVTYGKIKGSALNQACSLLEKQGIKLSYANGVVSVANYIKLYDIKTQQVEPIIAKAAEKSFRIAQELQSKKIRRVSSNISIFSKIFYKNYIKLIQTGYTEFNVDSGCTGCGICTKICPNKNIHSASGAKVFSPYDSEQITSSVANPTSFFRPQFSENCQHCFACVHWCPYMAIHFGENTKDKKRYHNPTITLEEML